MPTLSAFADEISQDPQVQMDALQANGIPYIELRGALGLNVLKFSNDQAADLKRQFADRGFGVSCICSPIGKIRIDEDYRKHFDEFKRAVELAEFFGAGYIRIFSYYPPEGQDVADYRGEVVSRLAEKVDYITERPVTLVLENESNLFGAFPERCAYLHSAIPSPKLVMAFDPANFVNMNVQNVYGTCWLPLRKYVGYFHIKDFKYGEKEHAVPAGQGDGNIPEMLRDAAADGYDGFLALEPHLGKAMHSTGQTGPELFKVAADALKRICAEVGWKVEKNDAATRRRGEKSCLATTRGRPPDHGAACEFLAAPIPNPLDHIHLRNGCKLHFRQRLLLARRLRVPLARSDAT